MAPNGRIDLHTHVLPGLDDGPPTVAEALALVEAAVAAGTSTIVATPHVNHRYPGNGAARILAATAALRREIRLNGIDAELRTGAEVALTRATEMAPDELALLRLGGGPSLLVECPESPNGAGFESALEWITARGNEIVLAHVERIPAFREEPELLARLVERGMRTQITAASLAGLFGTTVKEFALQLLNDGLVHVIASDAHAADRRGPDLGKHLSAAGIAELGDYFTRLAPAAILAGRELGDPPRPPQRRSKRLAFRRAS